MTSSPSEDRIVFEVTSVWFHIDDLLRHAYDDHLLNYLQQGDQVWLQGSEKTWVFTRNYPERGCMGFKNEDGDGCPATIAEIERICLTQDLYTRLLFGCLFYLSKGGSTADEQTKQRIDYLVNLGAWLGFGKE